MRARQGLLDVVTATRGRPTGIMEWTMRLFGEFDASQRDRFDRAADEVIDAAARTSPASQGRVVVDLRSVTVLDSAALGCLVRLRRRLTDATMVTLLGSRAQERLFEITGLLEWVGAVRRDRHPPLDLLG